MTLRKRTPCVGICSTTYGDLVCRGCKRFAHEIVQWNSYAPQQQERVWQRLGELRDAVVLHHLQISDEVLFSEACTSYDIEPSSKSAAIYHLLGVLVKQPTALTSVGLQLNPQVQPAAATAALDVLQAIDAEIYTRSVAHYERNFKIPL